MKLTGIEYIFFHIKCFFVSIFDGMNYFLSKVNAEKLVSSQKK